MSVSESYSSLKNLTTRFRSAKETSPTPVDLYNVDHRVGSLQGSEGPDLHWSPAKISTPTRKRFGSGGRSIQWDAESAMA